VQQNIAALCGQCAPDAKIVSSGVAEVQRAVDQLSGASTAARAARVASLDSLSIT
jgi:hypothetical protein